jgi:fatty acid-binding protein DegV
MLELLQERIPRTARQLRFGIVHVGCPEVVEEVAAALRERFGERETLVAPATPVLATHVGPGAWALAWQLED